MALTRCAALDLAPHGIRVNAVSPSLAMHPFLAKVTSDELLAELKQREAFGRAAEPWEVANVMVFLASDYASYLTGEVVVREQPACLRRRKRPRPVEPSCSRSLPGCSPRRVSRTPRSATSPTPPGSCPAASTTTSTPRSRWSTRSSRRFQEELFGRYDEMLASDDDARTKLEQAVRLSFEAIDHHRARGGDLPERGRLPRLLRAVRLSRRAARPVPRGVDDPARARASSPVRCARTSTSSSSTASSVTPSGSPCGGTAPAAR